MTTLSAILEQKLRDLIYTATFRKEWDDWMYAFDGEPSWDDRYIKAKDIIATKFPNEFGQTVWSSDVWQRIMLEEGMMA